MIMARKKYSIKRDQSTLGRHFPEELNAPNIRGMETSHNQASVRTLV
jgi:hypothetical protein